MSVEQVTCPHCGKKLSVDVITTIREEDEAAWRALLEKRLNVCTCSDCGTVFMVERPLIYRDSIRPFIVFYMDVEEGGDQHDLEQRIDQMAHLMAQKEGIEDPVVRLTTTIWDFIEKIFIWRKGYDDRLVEFAKQQLFRNTDLDQMSRIRHRLLLDFSNADPGILAFLIFDLETNQPVGGIHVPLEEYEKLANEFAGSPQLMRELDVLFPTCYVSVDRLI